MNAIQTHVMKMKPVEILKVVLNVFVYEIIQETKAENVYQKGFLIKKYQWLVVAIFISGFCRNKSLKLISLKSSQKMIISIIYSISVWFFLVSGNWLIRWSRNNHLWAPIHTFVNIPALLLKNTLRFLIRAGIFTNVWIGVIFYQTCLQNRFVSSNKFFK